MKVVFKISVIIAVCLMATGTYCLIRPDGVCSAWSVYDMLSDDVILFYESEIAGEAVVSDKSQKQIENIASRYSIDARKATGLLLVYDFCERTGGGVDFPELVKMKDAKIIRLVKARAKVYDETIDEQKRESVKEKAKEILGFAI